jgi:hypothetical protein
MENYFGSLNIIVKEKVDTVDSNGFWRQCKTLGITWFLDLYRMMGKVQKPSNSEYHGKIVLHLSANHYF